MGLFVNSSSLFLNCVCALSTAERGGRKTEEKPGNEIERGRPQIVRRVRGKEAKALMSGQARRNWKRNRGKEVTSYSTKDNTKRAGSKTQAPRQTQTNSIELILRFPDCLLHIAKMLKNAM